MVDLLRFIDLMYYALHIRFGDRCPMSVRHAFGTESNRRYYLRRLTDLVLSVTTIPVLCVPFSVMLDFLDNFSVLYIYICIYVTVRSRLQY